MIIVFRYRKTHNVPDIPDQSEPLPHPLADHLHAGEELRQGLRHLREAGRDPQTENSDRY